MNYSHFRKHLDRLIVRLKNDPAWPSLAFFNRYHLNSLEWELDEALKTLPCPKCEKTDARESEIEGEIEL